MPAEAVVVGFRKASSAAEWQAALLSLPGAHPLQSWAWGEIKGRWGWTARPLLLGGSQGNGRPLAAALTLKRQLGRLPFSMLYVPRGPTLDYQDEALRTEALAQLEQVARQEGAIFIKIDPGVVQSLGVEPEGPSPVGMAWVEELAGRGWRLSGEQVQFRNTVELDLRPPEAEILAAMKQKTRYNIGLAARKGVTVRMGRPADMPTALAMYQETAQRDGFAIRPEAYYLDAWRTFYEAGLGQPFVAEVKGEAVAAVFVAHMGGRAVYMYGASTEKERQRMPNYLLQWEAIRWAKGQGCTVYDFWGAPDEFGEGDRLWGVWRFKEGFNGRVVRHIGAWDYPARPLWYWLYTAVLPRYLRWLRRRAEPQG